MSCISYTYMYFQNILYTSVFKQGLKFLPRLSLKLVKSCDVKASFFHLQDYFVTKNHHKRYEPRHDKTNKMAVRPAKSQICLGIRPVWSESLLSAWRTLGFLATHWVHSKDSDQTGHQADLSLRSGWAESSLGAQSFCWFCHDGAQIIWATSWQNLSSKVYDQVALKPVCSATEDS